MPRAERDDQMRHIVLAQLKSNDKAGNAPLTFAELAAALQIYDPAKRQTLSRVLGNAARAGRIEKYEFEPGQFMYNSLG
jgi:hypothetical protein